MSRLRVTARVVFNRSVFGFAKNMITSNASRGLASYMEQLVDVLESGSEASSSDVNCDETPVSVAQNGGAAAGVGGRGNFRDISGIIQRIKDYKSKMMMSEKKGEADGGEVAARTSHISYTTFISMFLTSVVFYLINRYLLY